MHRVDYLVIDMIGEMIEYLYDIPTDAPFSCVTVEHMMTSPIFTYFIIRISFTTHSKFTVAHVITSCVISLGLIDFNEDS